MGIACFAPWKQNSLDSMYIFQKPGRYNGFVLMWFNLLVSYHEKYKLISNLSIHCFITPLNDDDNNDDDDHKDTCK